MMPQVGVGVPPGPGGEGLSEGLALGSLPNSPSGPRLAFFGLTYSD